MVKYRYAVYSRNKATTRRGKINPITYTKKQRKRRTSKNLASTGIPQRKKGTSNATPNRKRQRRAEKNRFRASERAAAYIRTTQKKKKPHRAKKRPARHKEKPPTIRKP